MSMTDPIADFLTRIRNGVRANKTEVICPKSKIKMRIAQILKQEGYLDSVSDRANAHQGEISVTLRYNKRNESAIRGIKRVSTPGQRTYVNAKALPTVRNGLGVAILSTSNGLMTDREARKQGVGGEVLCEVW